MERWWQIAVVSMAIVAITVSGVQLAAPGQTDAVGDPAASAAQRFATRPK
jgi:hypothetical protein